MKMKTFNRTCIIDDDSIYVFGAKKLMEFTKFCEDVTVFKNGQDALTHFQNEMDDLPCLILLDINMPIMDGWQFLNEFSKLDVSKKIPVFMISSSIDPVDQDKAKTYPIVKDYLDKPLKIDQMEKIFAHFK